MMRSQNAIDPGTVAQHRSIAICPKPFAGLVISVEHSGHRHPRAGITGSTLTRGATGEQSNQPIHYDEAPGLARRLGRRNGKVVRSERRRLAEQAVRGSKRPSTDPPTRHESTVPVIVGDLCPGDPATPRGDRQGADPTSSHLVSPPGPRASTTVGQPASHSQRAGTDQSEKHPIRVLLWNELAVLVEALARALADDSEINILKVGPAWDTQLLQSAPLLELVKESEPDVIIVNCTRGDADLSTVIEDLGDAFPNVKVAIIVRSLDPEVLRPYVRARAVGCVTADIPLADLVRAIRRINAGEVLFPPDVLMHLLTRDRPSRPEAPPPAASPLGSREREVLETLATGLSTEEAAARLGITVHTVRTHLKNVLVKLNAHSKLEAVMIALRAGIIRLPE